MIMVLSTDSLGISHATVHCDGFGVYTDEGIVEGIMITDSRGAAWAHIYEPQQVTCHAWKDGYRSVDFTFAVDEKHTRFRVVLPEVER
jgi:hypothetical protein